MPEENLIQDPAELDEDSENQPEEQIGEPGSQSTDDSAPSVEDQIAALIREKGLEGRWGDKTGLDAVGAALESYRHMETAFTRQQQQGRPPQATPDPGGAVSPQQPDPLDGFIADPQKYISSATQQQINQIVPQIVDQQLANQYVQDNPDIIANLPAMQNIMQRNGLAFTNANVRFAHDVLRGKRQDQFTAAQTIHQQGVQQGATLASQKAAARVEGGHKSPPRDGKKSGLEALTEKYGIGNIPDKEIERYFDHVEGKREDN